MLIFKGFVENEISPTHESVAEKLVWVFFAVFVDDFLVLPRGSRNHLRRRRDRNPATVKENVPWLKNEKLTRPMRIKLLLARFPLLKT